MSARFCFKRKLKLDTYKHSKKLKDLLPLLLDHIPNCIMLTDLKGRVIYVNKSTEINSGYTYDELIGKEPGILNGEEKADEIQREIISHMKQLKKWSGDILQRKKDGSKYLAEFEVFPIWGRDGRPLAWGSIQRDISKRKSAEEQLRFSEKRFSTIFNLSPVSMTILRYEDLRCIDVNDSFVDTTGYSRDEVIGKTPLDINIYFDPNDLLKMKKILAEQGFIRNHEVWFVRKNGEPFVTLLSVDVVTLWGERLLLTAAKDITELKKYEEEMAHLGRMEVIGQMAAGIGHEVRNPMTTVRGLIQILKEKQDCSNYKDYFDIMIDELDRANSIITEFLSIARTKHINKSKGNLNHTLDSIYPLIEATAMNKNINVIINKGDIPDLMINEKEIKQLVLNIFSNGLDAMPNGGNLFISTYTNNDRVILAIKDEGYGIDSEVLKKLGTPFVTNKEQGTGLGLAICYGIAARHNAVIEVDTSPNGTTFYVKFSNKSS
ncbi:PAS domain-containing sensor histidine kinase [Desulfofalx alkaliphila]|uniref:PAS domain-containing sensor histidine kinase n=1 Tax=Desulfofalx alkaliphila TaxID=105483 RepID=UPI000689AF91|nr:PAS domain-containing sensor histidine kinase [Desulfofalx alkaliphila]